MKTQTTETIAATLADDGWALSHHCADAGTADKPSKWAVTLIRNSASFTTEYTKGAGHRVWKSRLSWQSRGEGPPPKYVKAGERVGMTMGRLSMFDARVRDEHTEPEPPTLDEVLWCLVSDASCVRHGQTFGDFAGDMGYDTDSRKAEGIFNACRDTWSALIRLGADFDALDALFQDS